jgi:hypothetical protein
MASFRIGGTIICAFCLVLAGLFIWGVVDEDTRFWAIAVPVIIGVAVVLGIGFSIGRLMASTRIDTASKHQPEEETASSTDS